jgi:hypothetical protein
MDFPIKHPQYHIVNIPQAVDHGRLVMGQLPVSEAMIPVLFEIIRRASTQAKRHRVEVPYTVADEKYITEWLRREIAARTFDAGESVVSISPLRLLLNHFDREFGLAYMDYTTVPLNPWED